jgi:ribosome-associated protein
MGALIRITPTISLDESEIEEQFIRAPGPGGQKVNKTASAVQLRFDARRSPALSDAVFLRLRPLAGRRMTRDGVIVITANRFRAQEQNRRDALDRLIGMIRAAAVPPTYRRPTRPTKAAKKRRLDSKARQGALKRERGKVGPPD